MTITLQVAHNEEASNGKFFLANSYVAGGYDKRDDFKKLDKAIRSKEKNGKANRLFYLALPPSVYGDVTQQLRDECMSRE